jgi:hypothetical protein
MIGARWRLGQRSPSRTSPAVRAVAAVVLSRLTDVIALVAILSIDSA